MNFSEHRFEEDIPTYTVDEIIAEEKANQRELEEKTTLAKEEPQKIEIPVKEPVKKVKRIPNGRCRVTKIRKLIVFFKYKKEDIAWKLGYIIKRIRNNIRIGTYNPINLIKRIPEKRSRVKEIRKVSSYEDSYEEKTIIQLLIEQFYEATKNDDYDRGR